VNDPAHVADNDHVRSSCVRELLREHAPIGAPSASLDIPKVIVQFWDDSSAIPADVSECLDSWRLTARQDPDFRYILFDDTRAAQFIARALGHPFAKAFARCPHPAMRSDYFRLCYIFRLGGFYVDADEVYSGRGLRPWFRDSRLKVQPLCYDSLTERMVPADVFRRSQVDSLNWIFYVNNNPLIAPAFHPVIRLALGRATGLLLSDKDERFNIQSATGPGNLTRSLVRHALSLNATVPENRDFVLLADWDAVSTSRWPLSYRNDERNWRLWNPTLALFAACRSSPCETTSVGDHRSTLGSRSDST
jgi:hypothetical protein